MKRLILGLAILFSPAAATAAAGVSVGDTAPPFALADLFGRTLSLDYFDGRPGAIVFYSNESPFASHLLLDFRGYQERWGKDDLAIVAVNVDGAAPGAAGLTAVRGFADRLGVIFPVLLDGGGATRAAYGAGELPTIVVVDAGRRVSSILRGFTPALREEMKQNLLLAMGNTPAPTCGISRARSCNHIDERDPSANDPAVLAVRFCICHGDAEAARNMLSGATTKSLLRLDLRFALGNLMLLKGRVDDARRAFESLREHFPKESWGEWGLGLVALAEGDPEGALGHLRAAQAGGWSIPEAETAVLKYLEGYWRSDRAAPKEEQFLALFQELESVRACYRRVNQRG